MSNRSPQELAEACAAAMLKNDKASKNLGMEIISVKPGSAAIAMPVTETMLNGYSICHGGYIFTLADSCFAFSCNTYNLITLAMGCSIDYLEKVPGGTTLVATGIERKRTRTTGVYDITITAKEDGQEKLIALFRGKSFCTQKPIL